jgi:hypothetical protein
MNDTGDETSAPTETPVPPWEPIPPATRGRTARIVAAALGLVLLVACSVAVGSYFLPHSSKAAAPAWSPETAGPASSPESSAPTLGSPSPTSSGAVVESGDGLEPSAYSAKDINDLNRVCDENVYYPTSPKRAGKAPHPVVLLVNDGSGIRFQDSTYYFSEGLSKSVDRVWGSDDAKNVQMVACLDRVSTGTKIRTCKYDNPKPDTLTLFRAGWRLRVYEVATGRVLLDRRILGDDRSCPYVALYGLDKKIYTTVSDRVAVAMLRDLVKK